MDIEKAIKRVENSIACGFREDELQVLLEDMGAATTPMLADRLRSTYKSKGVAIRSVNNTLRRLMAKDKVGRKKKGKYYIYFLKLQSPTA